MVEAGASERIVAMALHPAVPAAPEGGDGDTVPGTQQPRPESVPPIYLRSASTKGEAEAGSVSATMAIEEGGCRGVRPPDASGEQPGEVGRTRIDS